MVGIKSLYLYLFVIFILNTYLLLLRCQSNPFVEVPKQAIKIAEDKAYVHVNVIIGGYSFYATFITSIVSAISLIALSNVDSRLNLNNKFKNDVKTT